MTFIELSHRVTAGMVTYPGLPGPRITDHVSRAQTAERFGPDIAFQIGEITLVSNTGTYVDTPFHWYADGTDLSEFPLERLADLPGVVVRPRPGHRALDAADLAGVDVAGRAVLVATGWSRHFGTERYGAPDHPHLTRAAVDALIGAGAALVGIDSVNIDDMADKSRPAHTGLLAAGVPIVEHLRGLEELPPDGFRFTAVPPPIAGMGTFPVRAYAVVGR
ncbi:Kynurenine formamidase [Thermomonospora echinospora]|uniref:Kynurenine formamidase n=1 Tax=Thermomonospora echinospora TaxID=1992 RepID=A0A1H5RZ62_9ACTN|nr:cyclase family protein [Thermomonospora echinospora]SEF43646.1 Kynurenine formamidase [Thermomonospora echinospora]